MNIVFLIEQSYIDSNIKNNLVKSFYINYKLTYLNQPYGNIPGNVGALVGNFTAAQFKHFTKHILSDLDKYHPFIRFIGLNYNRYWMTASQIASLLKLNISKESQYEVASTFRYPTFNLNQALISPIYTILFLLEQKQ